ncbi:HipA domain-containing protein [Stenotrophomonas sp. NPDC047960]|uniref:HipA domain-containing protein n=1 Tax=Stenotrophomonas sp. NPDC047960 TaxID=3364531 RepID=UPI003714839F
MPSGRIPTTHILKPPGSDYNGFVENEMFCLRLARAMGMPAAFSEKIEMDGESAICVERYDRKRTADGWIRIHQEDFCQALGVMPQIKYQNQGGPGAGPMHTPRTIRCLWTASRSAWRRFTTFPAHCPTRSCRSARSSSP